jgi:hypothetical protein
MHIFINKLVTIYDALTLYLYALFFIFFLQISQIRDPVADTTYKDLWLETAKVRVVRFWEKI